MSKFCQITGRKAMVGNTVSHSNNRHKRRFELNLKKKKFFLPAEDKWIHISVSTTGMRNINKLGITEAVKRARAKGYLNQ